jgi:hypothetical protein
MPLPESWPPCRLPYGTLFLGLATPVVFLPEKVR